MRLNGYKLTLSVVAVGAALWIGTKLPTMAEGDTPVTPGSINDPVVTKSYVDQQIANAGGGSQPGGQATQGQQVEVVTVPVGKFLIANDGAEFIVRAGKAVVYSADSNGISDLTDGVDITNGKPVPNNHFILFPRGGRGVTPAPGQKTGLTVMVRGAYELLAQ